MLSNKRILIITLFMFLLTFSCTDKGDDVLPRIDFENKIQLIEISKRELGTDVVSAFGGFFDDSPRKNIVAVLETDENVEWGIKFVLLQEVKGSLEIKFQTGILSGSHKESFLDKIKFPSFDNELLYYNSQSYFIGSGGGEIFAYILDFQKREVYSAHLIVESRKTPALFISKNTVNKEIKNFFMSIFRKDYPSFRMIEEDIKLE